jgi:Lrp/AsnC family transcriptional regulator, leucine-responsive regulatory protein
MNGQASELSVELPSERRNRIPPTFEPLDAIDRRIVAELQGDARLRVAELGRRVGLSPPAIADRMRRLEDGGVLSYRAEVEPRALGYSICAIVRVSPQSRDIQVIPDIAREVPEVTECYRITGEDCYFMKLYLRQIDELEPILDRFTPHGRTTTSIVHSAPVPPRPLPVVDRDATA